MKARLLDWVIVLAFGFAVGGTIAWMMAQYADRFDAANPGATSSTSQGAHHTR